jgi:hypothetical protein
MSWHNDGERIMIPQRKKNNEMGKSSQMIMNIKHRINFVTLSRRKENKIALRTNRLIASEITINDRNIYFETIKLYIFWKNLSSSIRIIQIPPALFSLSIIDHLRWRRRFVILSIRKIHSTYSYYFCFSHNRSQ